MNWEQLKTILWLRWRLMCNQSRRNFGAGIVVSILFGAAAALFALGSFAIGLLAGMFALAGASAMDIWFTWFGITAGFLFFWTLGLVMELQRSETIDLQKLMHLPVALGPMFVINFLASNFTLSVIIIVPAMAGLAIGLTFSRTLEMGLLLPLAATTVFMISAWTYCFRGWIAQLMTNPRRRRTVLMCVTFSLILLLQGPNLYLRLHAPGQHGGGRDMVGCLLAAQRYVPPLWLACGARALARGDAAPALLGTLGCFVIGALGLRRAHRSTIRFYHGETSGRAAASKTAAPPQTDAKSGFMELRLPYVPDQAGALALATFRSMLRAPEVKMALAISLIAPVIVGAMIFLRDPSRLPEQARPFIATGTAIFSVLTLIRFLSNQFGFDRDGFRALMLSPVDRRLILLGKNLACLPAAIAPGVILLGLICVPLRLPPLIIVATLLQLATLYLTVSMAGNFISIIAPQHIVPGTLRPTKLRIEIVLLMLFLQLVMMAIMTPIFLPAFLGWLWDRMNLPWFIPVNLIVSAALCAGTALIYWLTLEPLGRLLQKHETKILESVTTEVE